MSTTNKEDRNTDITAPLPVLGLLGVLFVGLKLTGHIAWSWWWVLLPFYGIPALAVAFVVFFVVTGAVVTIARGERW